MSEGFHPEKSRVNSDALADFIRSPLRGNLSEVPGVGPWTEKILRENGITSSYALIGKFLTLHEKGLEPIEHVDRFYFWLKAIGTPSGFRAGLVHCVCEKANTLFPGIYDEDLYVT